MIAQNTAYASAEGCANSTVFTPETEQEKLGFYLKEHDHFNGKMYFLKEIPGQPVGSGLHSLQPGLWVKTAYDYYTGKHALLEIYKTGVLGGDLHITAEEEAEAMSYFNALNAPA